MVGSKNSAQLSPLTLNRADPRPLYQQIHGALLARIVDGTYGLGDDLPSEKELAESLKVSTFTCKRAFDSLATDGLIDRGRGKRTRVVAAPQIVDFGDTLDGLSERALLEALNLEIDLQDCRFIPATKDIAEVLGIDAGAQVQKTVAIGRRQGSLIAQVTTYVPEDIGRMFDRKDLETTPRFVLILRDGRVRIDRVEQTIGACPLPAGVAAALEAPEGAPALKRLGTIFDDKDRAIEYFEAIYPWDRFSYRMTLRKR